MHDSIRLKRVFYELHSLTFAQMHVKLATVRFHSVASVELDLSERSKAEVWLSSSCILK